MIVGKRRLRGIRYEMGKSGWVMNDWINSRGMGKGWEVGVMYKKMGFEVG